MPSLTSMVRSAMHVCEDQPPVSLNGGKPTHVHGALGFLIALNASIAEVAYRASVHTAFFALELCDQLHRAHLGRPAHRPCLMVSNDPIAAMLDVPAGKMDRKASKRVLPGRSTPETSETRCWTWEN